MYGHKKCRCGAAVSLAAISFDTANIELFRIVQGKNGKISEKKRKKRLPAEKKRIFAASESPRPPHLAF